MVALLHLYPNIRMGIAIETKRASSERDFIHVIVHRCGIPKEFNSKIKEILSIQLKGVTGPGVMIY